MSIDAEAVARRYANREGCRFVAYAAVGIAVFDMNIRALVLESHELPPLDEFTLRFMGEGIDTPGALSDFLGVEPELIRDRLIELRRQEFIEVLASSNGTSETRLSLTKIGREKALSLGRTVMQEITIPHVFFHGLQWLPVACGQARGKRFLRPKEAKDAGLELIRAIPNRYPHPEEINIAILDREVKRGRKMLKGAINRDVVAVKSALKPVYTMYEPAVLLEYETTDERRQRQIAFVVDGQLREGYEEAFLRGRGQELLADLMTSESDTLAERVQRIAPPQVVERLGPLDDVESLATEVAVVQQEIADAEIKLETEDRPDTRELQKEEIAALRNKLAKLETERNQRKVRYLWTPEIRDMLWDALRTAQERLLILSGWISSDVVNDDFVAALEAALQRGVKVWIGYGFDKGSSRGERQREAPSWKNAEKALDRLARKYAGMLTYKDVGRSHEKRLICDNRYTFGGSFNLLSFSGEQRGRGKVRHEGADMIEDGDFCEEMYQKYMRLFFS